MREWVPHTCCASPMRKVDCPAGAAWGPSPLVAPGPPHRLVLTAPAPMHCLGKPHPAARGPVPARTA